MNEAGTIALANLLSALIPIAVRAYNEIAANHADIKPIADIIASAEGDWEEVIDKAKAEIGKFGN